MDFIIKTTPDELKRAQKWWNDLEMQWKFAYNEAVFGKGPVLEPPKDDELMILLIRADTLRFAGTFANHPNISVKLTNLSGLIPLYHLRYLSITHVQVSTLKPLVRHTQMEHLFVYNNELTSLEGVETMQNLKALYCQENKIESLEPVKNLLNLETLYVSRNKLTRLKGVTEKHADKLKMFHVTPNDDLPQKEIIRFQNEVGILCRKG